MANNNDLMNLNIFRRKDKFLNVTQSLINYEISYTYLHFD